jgi:hypothetical protein
MILPDKNISLSSSLLGMGSRITTELSVPQTVSSLWEKARTCEEIKTFEKFVFTLDLLYLLGLIELDKGIIRRKNNDKSSSL